MSCVPRGTEHAAGEETEIKQFTTRMTLEEPVQVVRRESPESVPEAGPEG